ncbi:hypothetical protein CC1G_13948 [Coprinopsis cinerea okayama7|uniref:HOOK N-terminal domain-containing protein n=1 Tax=Coprinopsis cinerea (strain Okayama-7 / 130 / ATCC MYA-4618 / FGSC 9003) TaxID=240176 RepID=D6RKQ6_COPC7|nr:hypothetical protein CC1G_13948 [Coprinopsis cinerea okayama7\|eukprot:XP_002911908.1 hypothetical protein CC1G_13948 [Coprinopsis cinerea okayama7\
MSLETAQHNELQAFINFFTTFELSRPLNGVDDLNDGAILFDILSLADGTYFRPTSKPSSQPSDNWVLRFSSLKRLYRLMSQYFPDVLQKSIANLEVPNLQAIAKDSDPGAILALCRLTVVIGVQCEKNKEFIGKIQELSQADQHCLMKAIEQVMGNIGTGNVSDISEATMTEDDHYYQIQSERSQVFAEKANLEKLYHALVEAHQKLEAKQEDLVSERDDALSQLQELRSERDSGRRNEKSDVHLRAELDREGVSQKSEENLSIAESELDKNVKMVEELTRTVDELQAQADEAAKLKDRLDEYKHAAEKLQKTENVMEKYKKKLQEKADLKNQLRALETQNADLVNKNAAIEEEYRKVAAFKPLMESYKNQIAELEAKNASRAHEIEGLRFELDQTRTKLRITTEERAKDAEALELYQERVRELELTANSRPPPPKTSVRDPPDSAVSEDFAPEALASPSVDTDYIEQGLSGELDDALTGRTMTDLKLQIKRLERELERAKKNEADSSRILVLENLLEDANRGKSRIEADYLNEHRKTLVLQRQLDEIREGKSISDGPEVAIALRQRLNETVEQLETLQKEHAELEVKFDTMNRELIIAKSDLTLVNKDQLDILTSLRESVNEDKAELEAENEKQKKQIRELVEKNHMQLEQINGLLMDKMSLQTEGIGQREKLLQRDFGDANAWMSALPTGKEIPEEFKQRWLSIHEECVTMKETIKTLNEKLAKAKQVLKTQDALLKEAQANPLARAGTSGEAEANFRAEIKQRDEEIAQIKVQLREAQTRYMREQELMISYIHNIGMRNVRQHLSAPHNTEKTSFLGAHRSANSHVLRRQ